MALHLEVHYDLEPPTQVMASTHLLLSRSVDLVKYGQWSHNDFVDFFTALVKQYGVRKVKTDFYTWMAKILYQVEIHKISKSELLANNVPNQFVDDIEGRIANFVNETKEKSLEQIIEEIKAAKDIDDNILHQVKDIVMYASSSRSCPVPTHHKDQKEILMKLCKAVKDTKGWNPRLTQMVSWCIIVLSGSRQLIQVGTGEGKSCIVAMLAAYRAMNGESVDIISSSSVLAERDAIEWGSFYKQLKITVDSKTNKREVLELRECYKCQVVYGTTQDFAGDWLRQRFQRENVRPDREFQCVIVDEVDSLMLDRGLEVVYINSEMPVMEPLNVILAKIWFVVNQFEDVDVEKALDLIHSSLMAEDSYMLPSETSLGIPADSLKPNNFHIPGFQEHINGRLKIWIENAFLAKTMTLGHEYIRHNNSIVPVDYSSTGVVQNDMKWGDGLQQFLEMKHQTRLSNMCMITNFKSNVNLFRSYKYTYGLTGTLGNKTELDLLQNLYPGIKTCKIPSFKRRKLYEKDGIVINDENGWVQTICDVVNKKATQTVYRGSRAVLVICETIKRAEIIHNELLKTIPMGKLKMYTNNNVDNSNVTGAVVTEGCVIVATNLAGRGTDLKVCPQVNVSGGLFVVQTFLPLNIRVEQQAFGRTAREGNPGSAQLIMCCSHFSESVKLMMALKLPSMLLNLVKDLTAAVAAPRLSENTFEETLKMCQLDPNEKNCEAMKKELKDLLNSTKTTSLEMEKQTRDSIVRTRLSQMLEDDIPKITKKEELFSEYLNVLDEIYKQPQRGSHEDIVASLHECWGMWLLMKFNENESTETLKIQLKKDLQSAKEKLYCYQSPSSMIYHYARTGNTFRHKGSHADSIEMYTRALDNNSCWPAIALYNRALSILSQANSGHIVQALADLELAEEAVDSCIKKLELTLTFIKSASKDPTTAFDNVLTNQFKIKKLTQYVLKSNIQKAIQVLQGAESEGYNVRIQKYSVLLLMLHPVLLTEVRFIEVLQEIMNIRSLGLDTLFSLETVFSFFKRLSKIFS